MAWVVMLDIAALRQLRAWSLERQLVYRKVQRTLQLFGLDAYAGSVSSRGVSVVMVYQGRTQLRIGVEAANADTLIVRWIEAFETEDWP